MTTTKLLVSLLLAATQVTLVPKKRTEPYLEAYQPITRLDTVRVFNPLKRPVVVSLDCGDLFEPLPVRVPPCGKAELEVRDDKGENVSARCRFDSWRFSR